MDSQGMPPMVLLAAVLVLVYTIYLTQSEDRILTVPDVWFIAFAALLSTLNALLQQAYYIARWQEVMIDTYESSMLAYQWPQLSLGPLSSGFEAVLYWLLFYIYNVQGLLFLFWALSLTFTVWHWQLPVKNHDRIAAILDPLSKAVAFVAPAVQTAIRYSLRYRMSVEATFLVANLLFILSLTLGATCMFCIIINYLRLRRKSDQHCATSLEGPIDSLTSHAVDPANEQPHRRQRSKLRVHVDSLLLLRFTIACVILLAFEAYLLVYSRRRYERVKTIATMSGPDLSVHTSIASVLNYVPGVSSGLLVFFLFGTSEAHREQYRRLLCLQPKAQSRRDTIVSLRTLRLMSRSQSTPGHVVTRDPELATYGLDRPLSKMENANIQVTSGILVTVQSQPT
ncbi:hypothetical protein MBLNU457_6124t2 [Dothideomycetes sp. NU457]